jgi:streptogramin lyase
VHFIVPDEEGVVWIGSATGLCNIHPSKQYFVQQLLWGNTPVSEFFYDDPAGKVYGTRIYTDRSLMVYDRKTGSSSTYPIPGADALMAEPFALAMDKTGLIWIGTSKGIYTFDTDSKKFSLFGLRQRTGIPDHALFVRQIVKDKSGNLWFSCYSKGLLRIEPVSGKTTVFFHDDKDPGSFPLFAITGLVAGKGEELYACDERRGVIRFVPSTGKWVHYSHSDSKYAALFDATDIDVDRNEYIWVTTASSGLVCLSPDAKTKVFAKDASGNILDETKQPCCR